MKIHSIDTLILDVPTIRPAKMSFATVDTLEFALVRVRSDEGAVGIGEAATIAPAAWSPESAESVKLTVDRHLAPHLVGQDPTEIARLLVLMDRAVVGNWFAKSALETALIDLVSRSFDMPAAQLLGGRYSNRIPCAWTLATGDAGRDVEEAQTMLDSRRHHIFKIKIGAGEPAADMARVLEIRRRLPTHASIRVDVNQGWDETTARRCCRELDDAGIDLVEQPVVGWNHGAMHRLKSENRLMIMADEGLSTIQSALEIVRYDAVDAFSLKPNKSGGLFATRKIAGIAEAAGIACYGGSMLETAVGTAAALHVFATLSNLTVGCELFCPWLLRENVTTQRIRYEEGCVLLPEGPGIGVDLDEEQVARFQRDA